MNRYTFKLGNGNVYVRTVVVEELDDNNEMFGKLELEDNDFNVNIEFRDVEQILKVSDWMMELYDKIKEIKK